MAKDTDDSEEMLNTLRRDQGAETEVEDDEAVSEESTAPMAGPMMTPEPKTGEREMAIANLSIALQLIQNSLAELGSDTQEAKDAIRAVKILEQITGTNKEAGDLQRAEILRLMESLSPEQQSMAMNREAPPPPAAMPPTPTPQTAAPPMPEAAATTPTM